MPDYKKMYYIMFNAATDAIKVLQHYHLSDDLLDILKKLIDAQKSARKFI